MREADGPTIVCAQAGEVNTGAFDPIPEIAEAAETLGLAARRRRVRPVGGRASPDGATSSTGVDRADSRATDAHKWLNVPYDCGLAFVAHPEAHRASMRSPPSTSSSTTARDQMDWTPEFLRRGQRLRGLRGVALARSDGVAELVERLLRPRTPVRRRDRLAFPAARS